MTSKRSLGRPADSNSVSPRQQQDEKLIDPPREPLAGPGPVRRPPWWRCRCRWAAAVSDGRALTTDLDRFVCGRGQRVTTPTGRPTERTTDPIPSHHIRPGRLARHFSVSILASRIRKNDLVRQSATAGSMGASRRHTHTHTHTQREREREREC